MEVDGVEGHKHSKSLVNKIFFVWKKNAIFSRDTAGNPERARKLHLARAGSQSQRRTRFILPARGASHLIKVITIINEFLT